MLNGIVTITLFLFVFFSCSSSTNKATDHTDHDLSKVFELSKEQTDTFLVVYSDENEKVEPMVATQNKTAIKKEQNSKENAKKTNIKNSKRVEQKEVIAKPIESLPEYPYPKDYPEELKKYDEKSKQLWELFSPVLVPGESFYFVVKYLGVTAGYLTVSTKNSVVVANEKAYSIKAHLKTAKFYSYIYQLDDVLESYVKKDSFLPIKFSLIQRETKQSVDNLELFSHKDLKAFTFYKKVKKKKETEDKKEGYIPKYFQDSFSALYFVRGLPLIVGEKYEFPVVTKNKIWILKVFVDKIETLELLGKKIPAIKIKAETHFPGALERKGDILFWFANDSSRALLKFSAKIKIGSIEGSAVNASDIE